MASYRNVNTGAVVSVSDDLVLDSEWESIGSEGSGEKTEKKASAKKTASSQ